MNPRTKALNLAKKPTLEVKLRKKPILEVKFPTIFQGNPRGKKLT